MKRAIGAVLFVVYSIIAITVTVLLLSFNDYRCSEIGDYTVYIANNDLLEPEYQKGSILIIERASDRNVQVGDEIFLYKVINTAEYEIVTRTLERKTQRGSHIVYEVNGEETYDNSYFIGKVEDTTVIGSPWGTILSILESKWGYLFCIVIVSLLLFLQEVFDLVIELKYGGTKGTKAANAANAKRAAKGKKTSTAKTGTKTAAKATAKPAAKTTAKTVAKPAEVKETQTGVEEEG